MRDVFLGDQRAPFCGQDVAGAYDGGGGTTGTPSPIASKNTSTWVSVREAKTKASPA